MKLILRGSSRILLLALCIATSAGAANKPDLSSPKRATLAFATALRTGDIDTIRASTIGSPEDYKLMESMASMMGAAGKLHNAAAARFGPKDADKVAGPITGNSDTAGEIESSHERVEGDTATIVTSKGEANALKLKKSDGDWKIDLSQFPQKSELARQIPFYQAVQKVLSQGAADVSAGKYQTAEEASQDVSGRLAAAAASVNRRQNAPPARH